MMCKTYIITGKCPGRYKYRKGFKPSKRFLRPLEGFYHILQLNITYMDIYYNIINILVKQTS